MSSDADGMSGSTSGIEPSIAVTFGLLLEVVRERDIDEHRVCESSSSCVRVKLASKPQPKSPMRAPSKFALRRTATLLSHTPNRSTRDGVRCCPKEAGPIAVVSVWR